MPTVLVTGVSRYLGGRLAAQLAADPAIERVIGIDVRPPHVDDVPRLGRTEFVRADIRSPHIAKVMSQARVTSVVHAGLLAASRGVGGRTPMHEMNVIGTMQLLAACQKSDHLERLVLASTAAVYGSGPDDPAVFTEDMQPLQRSQSGYARDAVEVEGYVRGFARRRRDVEVTVLRLTNVVGPRIDSPFVRYLAMPLVPAPYGFDPRMQLVHEQDAVEVLRRAATTAPPGTFNVAGDGVTTLSQLIRRAGRLRVPVPARILGLAGELVGSSGVIDVSAESRFLVFGRGLDTTALQRTFGYTPRYSTLASADACPPGAPTPGRTVATAFRRRVAAAAAPLRGCARRDRRPLCRVVEVPPVDPADRDQRAGARVIPLRRGDRALGTARRLARRARRPVPGPGRPDASVHRLEVAATGGPEPGASHPDDLSDVIGRRLRGDYPIDEFGFDRELTERALVPVFRPLYERWFRVEVNGIGNVPDVGPALLVANHAGGLWALDAVMTGLAVHLEHPAHRFLRMLGADLVFRTPVVGPLARKAGATLACAPDVRRLLAAGELVGVWPEGFKGIGKPYRERYKLQRFGRGGFVAAAIAAGVPIVPVSIIGSEEIHPVLGNASLLARMLDLPYFPLTPTFPWLGPLGLVPLPSKWYIEFGTPIATDRLPAQSADDPVTVFETTDRVREAIQSTLYRLLVQRRSVWR